MVHLIIDRLTTVISRSDGIQTLELLAVIDI
jgi:hypothetical protein